MYLSILKEKKDLLKYYETPFYVYINLSNLCKHKMVFSVKLEQILKKNVL